MRFRHCLHHHPLGFMRAHVNYTDLPRALTCFALRGRPNVTKRIIRQLNTCSSNIRRPTKLEARSIYQVEMKRSASSIPKTTPRAKKPRPEVPEYHLTPSIRDESGEIVWPAPREQIERARDFIRECVSAKKKTLIVPDKDADGLTSGAILQKTLILLGLEPDSISAHLLQKGTNIHDERERAAMAACKPDYIFVLDQGSRKSPPVIDAPHKALVIDHHWALDEDFPEGSQHVTACNSPPVATSSLLTYHICNELHEEVQSSCDWLCAMGTHGDLGNTLKWEPPFPDMKATFKTYTKKAVNDAVSLINAPRRTATYGVPAAWTALITASSPKDLLQNSSLLAARAEVNAEVERCTHTAPKFSSDGKIAVFRINSAAQVHPVIATRWAGHLQSPKLEVILVANEGYLPGMVNFSCRIPRSARARERPVNIIETLKDIAARAPNPTLRDRLGESFARGHKEASGGIVPKVEFEEFLDILEIGKKPEISGSPKKAKAAPLKQANTLTNYFSKQAS
ncbi:DHH phosphoesterase [Annulohypoxylon truncatum]|uniref:DHH phosphoesterase n=1 Tax=Annulohypoxylon truncatum TaxID=327061 RepID=UPI002008147F|nr:DHH phosphoesterase [Annulohypoxylon truncatum]KAI1208422.1 DHH phosphoesterase [Annulohypoxylon truncatum]